MDPPLSRRSRRIMEAAERLVLTEERQAAERAYINGSDDDNNTASLSQSTPVKHAVGDDAQDIDQDIDTDPRALLFTPQVATPSVPATIGSSHRVTRSTSKDFFEGVLLATPSALLQDRLRHSVRRNPVATTSSLEDAPDIPDVIPLPEHLTTDVEDAVVVNRDDGDSEDPDRSLDRSPASDVGQEQWQRSRPTIGGLRLRRSSRIRGQEPDQHRAPSPSTVLSTVRGTTSRVQKRRKKETLKAAPGTLRRSLRLSKPLDSFHKYVDLPIELKIMVWEAVIEPRVVYVNNRSSIMLHGQTFGVQNERPVWFMTCRLSVWAAQKNYNKMFGIPSPHPALSAPVSTQDVSPTLDYVIFEPCHGGCRGYFCAQSYTLSDRAKVQNLVVQIDSVHLAPGSEAGWASISRTWTSVRTLYMMKPPIVRGLDQRDKAIVRVKESDREVALRKAFDAWKKGPGQSSQMAKLEFVQVVEAEPHKPINERYLDVTSRQTGLPDDIIHG